MAIDKSSDELYDQSFFEVIEGYSLSSADVVIPIVVELVAPESVIDVGCGRGAWLKTFADHGVSNIAGVDGSYVKREQLLIPSSCFTPVDLSSAFSLEGRYDLATCLEVGEHLPESQSDRLVAALTQCSDVVLFSAAVPGQVGTHHVNLQFPQFWIDLFASRGFLPLNSVRSRIRDDQRVSWWYRQNIILFVAESKLSSYPKITSLPMTAAESLEWVHRHVFDHIFNSYTSQSHRTVRVLFRSLLKALGDSIRFRLSGSRADLS